ncbi:hypothetical protein Micbo1qcDRAFT_219150 [Microdochium bolleyi]|uniref:Fungal N-terminal domain-containing protein n=1 Tax=Microdochium bolleyi TaxID=196109 RepID=A0A136INQ7_9PEZI|nr:hypothetical protein Micbo1qcDRAFT_219150 [Microdochium bolleyi]
MEVAGSCLALAGATVSVSLAITKLVTEIIDLKEDLGLVKAELESIDSILFLIADNVHKITRDGAMVSKSLATRLDEVICACQSAVQETSEFATKYSEGGLRRGVGWVVAGKRDLGKMREHLRARRMDLDVCLNMLNISLASGLRIGTTQILDQQAIIHDDVQGIMKGIQSLQADSTKMEELLELLRSMATHRTDNFMMDRFIDSLTSYAETVHDRSVIGNNEHWLTVLPDWPEVAPLTLEAERMDSTYGSNSSGAPTSLSIDDGSSVTGIAQLETLHISPMLGDTAAKHAEQSLETRANFNAADLQSIESYLSRKGRPNGTHPVDLISAVRAKSIAGIGTLLNQGADPDAHGPESLPVLFDAIRTGSVDIIKFLANVGADLNKTYRFKGHNQPVRGGSHITTPLLEAIRCAPERPLQSAFALVRTLIEVGADPNGRSQRQHDRPRSQTTDGNRPATARNTTIATTTSDSLPPLSQCILVAHSAAATASTKLAAAAVTRTMSHISLLLICRGADPNGRGPGFRVANHPLVLALRYRNSAMLGVLTMRGARLPLLDVEIGRNEVFADESAKVTGSPDITPASTGSTGDSQHREATSARTYCAKIAAQQDSSSTITKLIFSTALRDGRETKQSWLAVLISQQPQLGTWCLLDAISSLSFIGSPASAAAELPTTGSSDRDDGGDGARYGERQPRRGAERVLFLLTVLVDAGAQVRGLQESVQYRGKRNWVGALLGDRKSAPVPREAVLEPLKLVDEIWLKQDTGVSRNVLKDMLLGNKDSKVRSKLEAQTGRTRL